MKNKNNMNFIWLIICIICLVVFVSLGIFSGVTSASAAEYESVAEYETESEQEDVSSLVESLVSSFSGSTEDIELQIEMWQEYIDKYIMPNALAVLTSLSMVFAVFSKFKYILNLYKENKEQFDLEKETVFAELKSEVSAIIETLADVKTTTLATIDNMPISQIQDDLTKAKDALETEMSSIQDFTRMFEIFLASERKLVDTSYLSTSDKKEMKKLFYEGEQLAKKNQTTLADTSDFVLATIGSGAAVEDTAIECADETTSQEDSLQLLNDVGDVL